MEENASQSVLRTVEQTDTNSLVISLTTQRFDSETISHHQMKVLVGLREFISRF